jgi:transglutaminase-like putative cysteine protease
MRSHKVLFFGMLLVGSAVPAVSFGQLQAPTKEELSMTSDPKAPGADAVYLFREEREDDPKHFRSVYARIKVLTEKGKELATVQVRYSKNFVFNATGDNSSRSSSSGENHFDAPDPNHTGEDRPWDPDSVVGHVEVADIQARTIHPDGTIIPLKGKPSDLLHQKENNSQVNEMTFNLPDVTVGSIIEYYYQVRYDRFQVPPEWQIQQPYFVHKARYVFYPDEQFQAFRNVGGSAGMSNRQMIGPHGEIYTDLRAVSVLPPGKTLAVDPTGKYAIDFTDIPAIPVEAYAPPLATQIYQADFYYTYTPDTKEFWQKQTDYWAKDLNAYIAPTQLIKQTAAEQVAEGDSPLVKAKKLYAFVQSLENTDITVAGSAAVVGDTIPRGSVEAVLQHKRGTGQQLAALYLALAKAAGLTARPERICSRDHRVFAPEFMSTEQLDSLLIGVTVDGKEIVLDPGEKMAPFQILKWSHAGAGGVAIAADGKVEIVVTPLQANAENTTIRVGSLNVSAQGEISGTLKIGFVGQQALQLRQMAVRSNAEAVQHRVNELLANQVPDGIEAHVDHFANLDNPEKQLLAIVPVKGTLAVHSGKRLILPRIFFESKESVPFPAEQSRVLPVDMHYAAQDQEQITYVFPAGFTLEGTPEDKKLAWEDNAVYQLRSKVTPTSITSARVLARGFTLLDAKEYGELRDFYQKVAAADQQQIVLTAAQTGGN